MLPLESVPNFSEGRDRATIDAIASALGASARLLDVHADEDANFEKQQIQPLRSFIVCSMTCNLFHVMPF